MTDQEGRVAGCVGAALVDVGGTLWPDRWPRSPDDDALRIRGLCAALPGLAAEAAVAVLAELRRAGRSLDGRLEQDVDRYVGGTLRRLGWSAGPSRIAAVLDAMWIPAGQRVSLFSGARSLLAAIREEGLRCVIVSNTVWRSAAAYRQDFEGFGVADQIDGIVTSVDVGMRKPHPAIFNAGAAAASTPIGSCVVIGNSEALDVLPARALGLRAVRVAIEEPPPETSAANTVARSLHEAAAVVRALCRAGLA
jgi:FMN phosphatase YigB (HAD superfamily)